MQISIMNLLNKTSGRYCMIYFVHSAWRWCPGWGDVAVELFLILYDHSSYFRKISVSSLTGDEVGLLTILAKERKEMREIFQRETERLRLDDEQLRGKLDKLQGKLDEQRQEDDKLHQKVDKQHVSTAPLLAVSVGWLAVKAAPYARKI